MSAITLPDISLVYELLLLSTITNVFSYMNCMEHLMSVFLFMLLRREICFRGTSAHYETRLFRFDSAKWIFGSFSVMILLNSVGNYVNSWGSTYCIVDMAFHLVYTFLELCQVQLLLSSFV